MLHFAVSDLVLHCLPMSLKKDTSLSGLNSVSTLKKKMLQSYKWITNLKPPTGMKTIIYLFDKSANFHFQKQYCVK